MKVGFYPKSIMLKMIICRVFRLHLMHQSVNTIIERRNSTDTSYYSTKWLLWQRIQPDLPKNGCRVMVRLHWRRKDSDRAQGFRETPFSLCRLWTSWTVHETNMDLRQMETPTLATSEHTIYSMIIQVQAKAVRSRHQVGRSKLVLKQPQAMDPLYRRLLSAAETAKPPSARAID